MKKQIANILTSLRCALGVVLLCFNDITKEFIMIFTFTGLTDLIDGPIARKTNSISLLGSRLDTIADIIVYSSLLKIAIAKNLIKNDFLVWIVCAFLIYILSPVISFIKFHKAYFIHSWSAKILGFSCFLIPFFIYFLLFDTYLVFLCVLISISACENVIMQLLSKKPNSDASTIFSVMKDRKALTQE